MSDHRRDEYDKHDFKESYRVNMGWYWKVVYKCDCGASYTEYEDAK